MKYVLNCSECEKTIPDNGHIVSCHPNTLLKTEYKQKEFIVREENRGIWRFIDWLPVKNKLDTDFGPVTYKSEGLADKFGLDNLYITFTGYWPEKGGISASGTFKDLEAQPVIRRNMDYGYIPMVLATDGNTGRAFAYIATVRDLPLHIVTPEESLGRLWLPIEPSDKVHVYAVKGDYCDAIEIAGKLSGLEGVIAEGGAKNIARRDGMATVMLDGVNTMGRLPNHYFQAVGSGPGAIAALEAAKRLIKDGRFGNILPKINVAQNVPFTPIYNAYTAGRREILPKDILNPEESIRKINAKVLSNRKPAYSIKGGLYDILSETNGKVFAVTNEEAMIAERMFMELEGIDLVPAATITTAALIQAVRERKVRKEDYILLNITGCGYKRIQEDFGFHYLKPERVVDKNTKFDEILV